MKKETITLGELFTALTSPPDPWYGDNSTAQELVDRYILKEGLTFGKNFDFKLKDNFYCPQGNDHYPQQYKIPQQMLVVIWYLMYLDSKKINFFSCTPKNSDRYSWGDCKPIEIEKSSLKSILNDAGYPLPISLFGKCKNNTRSHADKYDKEIKSAWDDIFQEEIIDKRISEILSKNTSSFEESSRQRAKLKDLFLEKAAIYHRFSPRISLFDILESYNLFTNKEITDLIIKFPEQRHIVAYHLAQTGMTHGAIGAALALEGESTSKEATQQRGYRLVKKGKKSTMS